jgi:Putative peptidoglycan binding domain
MAEQPIGYDLYSMKMITLLGLAGIAFVSLSQPMWAGPRGGGSGFAGGHVGGGGRVGGFAGGGSRAAPAFYGGGFRGAPAFRSNGAYFTGRSVGTVSRAPRFYYGGNRMTAVRPHGFTPSVGRYTSPYVGRYATANRQPGRVGSTATAARRQPNRVGSIAGRNRVSDPRTSTATNRQSFVRSHSSERHNANNWHRDWDRHHAHFHHNRVFVFVNGFWWGLDSGYYPWAYYPNYDYGDYPYNSYYGNPYDYYNYSPYNDDDQPGYSDSDQSAASATVSAIQSELAKLGYYNGAIDGTLGDQTEAAIARYQEDRDLSVTGTVDAATLQSLGIK